MIDIVIRDCGHGEWLPIIVVNRYVEGSAFNKGSELYRGERQRSPQVAFDKAIGAWATGASGNIADFKAEQRIA